MKIKPSPHIIFNLQGFKFKDTSSENSFYRCRGNDNYLSYISRESAISNDTNKVKMMREMLPVKSILGYMNNRKGSTGIFNSKGEISQESLEELRKKMQTTRSNIWSAVISFTPEFSAKICNDKEQARQLINDNLHFLFDKSGIDPDNIEWAGAYHTNTDNRHIHLLFFEKEPKMIDSKGKPKYTSKIMLPKDNINSFKYNIAKGYNEANSDYYNYRDMTRYGISDAMKSNKQLLGLINYKAQPIIADGHYQYARLSTENKKVIKGIVRDILAINPNIKQSYDYYKKGLMDEQANIMSIYTKNNMQPPKTAINFYDNRMDEFNNRLCNEVLNVIKATHIGKLPYINFKSGVHMKHPPHHMMSRNKGMGDIPNSVCNKIIKSLQQNVQQMGQTMTDEAYKIRKKLEGEVVYE